ncbi:hypothetical protein [Sphingomonas sp. SRS2]|uniref:hypothetical protein n=1 Tax=Sphingomonas sp. SRS2 TaxID=133190 RepID=UPI0006184C83|nr:hypothetical protein [Sphingomonas sp. SRS2]KKC24890.1 hypothetical protein WP12_16820 [Sphingomonas sp. SRS2]
MDGQTLPEPFALDGARAVVVLDALGGTGTVSGFTFTPTSTVDSWRRIGMSKARFDHVCLAAAARGKSEELASALEAIADEPQLPLVPATAP